jgi:GABA permease
MRVPASSERKAFHLAVGFALLTGISVLAGLAVTPLYGITVFGVGLLAAVSVDLFLKDPDKRQPLREAAGSPHPHGPEGEGRRILVVANEVLAGPALCEEIVRRGGSRPRVDIMAPVLTSRSHYWSSDYDRELADAQRRLEGSLAWAASQGLEARGEIGDPDPRTALEDELRDFGADEVIVVTHPRDRANWLEPKELERLRAELDVPVTHVVSDRESRTLEVED